MPLQDLNEHIEYTMWSVFAYRPESIGGFSSDDATEVKALLEQLTLRGVTVRGLYRLSGMRADADWMIWWHAPEISVLQDAYLQLRRTVFGQGSTPVWSTVGIHRPAEFNRAHLPAYLQGIEPERFLTIYPFVRSYEWYLLPAEERRDMLVNHGAAARDFPDVVSNTVSAFALGDYEWMLALEAPQLHRLVDLMRAFRDTEARRHVREEVPFYTGERMSPARLITGVA